jgi:P-type Mg2+ transporter
MANKSSTLEQGATTNLKTGLTSQQAKQLYDEQGANIIISGGSPWFSLLLRQCNSGFVYLLLAATLISFFLGEHANALIMAVIIFVMVFFGFYQKFYADRTLQSLREQFQFQARVMRDGKRVLIDVEELVVGDLVFFQSGDAVCADVALLQTEELLVDESTMTGESLPVAKQLNDATNKASSLLYAGTKIISGTASGIVTATGMKTQFGELVGAAIKPGRLSNFSQGLNRFSIFVLYFVSITIGIIFLMHLAAWGTSVDVLRLLVFYMTIAISVVPQALQVVINFALARAASVLAKQKVLVKRFTALEDLGSVQVLCVDKTGTLTENELTVAQVCSLFDQEDALLVAGYRGAAAHHAGHVVDSFDHALSLVVHDRALLAGSSQVVDQLPFDPLRKTNTTLVSYDDIAQVIVRGAFEAVVACSSPDEKAVARLKHWIDQQESAGRRVLTIAAAVADPQVEIGQQQNLTLMGAISFQDTIKESAQQALQEARELNVAVKMLTGDSAVIAHHVAQELGFFTTYDVVIQGAEYDALTGEEKDLAVQQCDVFARVSPLQKYDIIKRLQKNFDVGFVGEGINDVPSLKAATVGFAVSNACGAAKDAADIMLLAPSMESIIDGVRQGRAIFINTVKYLRLVLSSNFSNFYTLAIISLMNRDMPMLPVQLLLVNLLTDGPMLFVATDHVDQEALAKPTRSKITSLITMTLFFGITCTVADFIFLSVFYQGPTVMLQTNWFVFSILSELAFFFSVRTRRPIWSGGLPSWQLLVATACIMVLTVALPFTRIGQRWLHLCPLQAWHFGFMAGVIALSIAAAELVKMVWYRYLNHVGDE